ncbi:MAG: ParB/RepB/Spo0J family partition protein [Planctomycetes bacterium]|nr:ParB/RepB/Spo0J family partition protein [Planctomycetota bacterium]
MHPDDLRPNRFQPRSVFDTASIETLAASIKEQGVLQPILVRKTESGYEIVAGERRWRACKALGLSAVPIVVKEMSDRDTLGAALVENVQREDLNPLEKAKAFAQFMKLFALTQEEVAQRMGMDRSTVANFIRLLDLPAAVQEFVSRGTLSMGHARALVGMEDAPAMLALCRRIQDEGMSVRRLEAAVAGAKRTHPAKRSASKGRDPNVAELEDRLRKALGTQVHLRAGKGKGVIEVEYYSNQDLSRIIGLLER